MAREIFRSRQLKYLTNGIRGRDPRHIGG